MMTDSHTIILPYDHAWKGKFLKERENIKSVFGESALVIEHIGSTSIEGLASKPIIDIAVVISDHEDAIKFNEALNRLGYTTNLKLASTERIMYRKADPIQFHLSICFANKGGFLPRQLVFRDYLRTNAEARDAYQELKIGLLKKDPSGTDEYIAGKSDFVSDILKKAGWKYNETFEEYKNRTTIDFRK